MLSIEEREALNTAIDKAVNTAKRMKNIVNIFSEKRNIVSEIIITKNSKSYDDVEAQINRLVGILERLDSFVDNILAIKKVDSEMPEVFKSFLQKEFVLFNWDSVDFANMSITSNVLQFLTRDGAETSRLIAGASNTVSYICNIPNYYINHINLFERKISTYVLFDKIKWIENNIVMVGANGSGKSSFARQLRGKLSSNISILSAQHLLVYKQQNNIPASNGEISKLRSFQKSDKLSSADDFKSQISDDMNQLITTLIAEHTDNALNYYGGQEKKQSYLNATIEIWEELIEHRNLVADRGNITVSCENGSYSFNRLSDGEKAVFYYIAHILLVEENSYIIIDEPENHLHMAICSKLWDKLEEIRSDCKFIYLTHNLDFAVSRSETTIIWNKKFIPPDIWDFEIIGSDETLPNTLLLEVLGSRKKICFCEGDDRSSLDYKLHSLLFPEFTVIPVSGHLNVVNYTNAYNQSPLFSNTAVGIIDGDCHLPEQIDKWKEHHIFTVPTNEVENILCDEILIRSAISNFMSEDNAFEKYLNAFWSEFEQKKTLQASWYINNIINNKFKSNFLHEKNDIKKIKDELIQITSTEEIDRLYQNRLQKIEQLISNKNYEEALKIANFKGALTKKIAKNNIVDNYQNRILGLLKKTEALRIQIKQKYFSDFYGII